MTFCPDVELVKQQVAWFQALRDLRKHFPSQFPSRSRSLLPDPAWVPLVERLCQEVDDLLPEDLKPHFHWLQIKEKYATLRAYWSWRPDVAAPLGVSADPASPLPLLVPDRCQAIKEAIDRRIDAATAASAHTCGDCGAPGSLRRDNWWQTRCDEHARFPRGH